MNPREEAQKSINRDGEDKRSRALTSSNEEIIYHDLRPRQSCSGSGRIERNFQLKDLRKFLFIDYS